MCIFRKDSTRETPKSALEWAGVEKVSTFYVNKEELRRRPNNEVIWLFSQLFEIPDHKFGIQILRSPRRYLEIASYFPEINDMLRTDAMESHV